MDNKATPQSRYSWWEKRTKIEKCLFVLMVLSAIVIIYLASNLLMKFPSSANIQQNICMTDKCIRSANSILEKIDRTVDPCDDFYKFACGNYVKKTIIPDEKVLVTSMSTLGDKIDLQLKTIFEEPIRDNDSKSMKLVKTVYKSCMNTTRIEKEALVFIKNTFKDLGGFPVMEGTHWNEKNFDWKKLLYRTKNLGWRRGFFFSLYIATDTKNSSRKILQISQPCMPAERLKKGFNDTTNQAYYEYLVNLVTLFGADKLAATIEMREVVEFEMNLANITVPREKRKNESLEYNLMTIKELQRNFSTIPWLQFINVYLAPIDMVTSDDVINVALPQFLSDLENLLLKTKKRVLANYMFSRLLKDSALYLPESFLNNHLQYIKTVWGVKQMRPRWKECSWEAERFHLAASSVYVKKFFNRYTKNKVKELVSDVQSAFHDTLRKIGWMDRKTKKHAILKAENMQSFIGYPDEILDDDKVDEYYDGLEIDGDNYYLKVKFNISKFFHMKNVKKLRELVIKHDWKSHAYAFIANAFYDQSENAFELPAGILQGEFFDFDRPQYLNYGSLGEIIGHEITHGFDDQGRQYDKDGNLIDWWEPETNRTFARKSQCLVEQYGNYTVPEIEMNLNGVNNLGENIADNGGIKIAYRGYLKWLERNKAELGLPGLPFTPRQLFWISSANVWCAKYRKEYLKQQITSGSHAPNYFRIIVPFMNSDYFGKDFNCPLGTPMNPKYKCRVW